MKKTFATLFVLVAVHGISLPAAAKNKPDPGLVELSRDLINLEEKIVKKLRADQKKWREAVTSFNSGVAKDLEAASLARHQMERASLAIDLTPAVKSEELRRAVLLRLAEIDLTIDQVAMAKMAEVNQLDAERQAALTALIALVGKIRENQGKLLDYLEDRSLRKRLSQIDTGLIADAVTEARKLRASLEGEETDVPESEVLRERLDSRIAELRAFLGLFAEDQTE